MSMYIGGKVVAPSVVQPVTGIDGGNRVSRYRWLYWIRIVWGNCSASAAVGARWAIGGGGCTLKIANGSRL